MIDVFFDEYRWLSNFHPCQVYLDGVRYPSVENAYQAAKTINEDERDMFTSCPPGQAKRLGRLVVLRPDWEQVKDQVMRDLLGWKFANKELKDKLLATGDQQLVEGNYWHDNYWGSCTCQRCGNKGKNQLGKLLMQVRSDLLSRASKK